MSNLEEAETELLSAERNWAETDQFTTFCYDGHGKIRAQVKMTAKGFYDAAFYPDGHIGTFMLREQAKEAVLQILTKR